MDVANPLLSRITVEPDKRSGSPCIRGMRITIWDILEWKAEGQSDEEILIEHPELQKEDLQASFVYAADVSRRALGK